jgi:tetratricopeptide (TPR) repeat protein
MLEDLNQLYAKGDFAAVFDLIEQISSQDNNSKLFTLDMLLLKVKVFYLQGNLQAADEILNEISKYTGLNTSYKQLTFVLQVIIKLGLGFDYNFENLLSELMKIRTDDLRVVNYLTYTKAMVLERLGRYLEALDEFKLSLKIRKNENLFIEQSFIFYKMANICRVQGDLPSSLNYLKLSLSEILDDSQHQELIATIQTSLGQNSLMMQMFDTAISHLVQGLNHWKSLKNPFGLAWALGELVMVNFMLGNTSIAFEQMEELYSYVKPHVPPHNQSLYLHRLIHIGLEINKDVTSYLDKLKQLTKYDSTEILERFKFCKALMDERSNSIAHKFASLATFSDLSETASYLTKMESLVKTINLLLFEIQLTENHYRRNELINDIDGLNQKLIDEMRKTNSLTLEFHSYLIRSKLELILDNVELSKNTILDALTKESVLVNYQIHNHLVQLLKRLEIMQSSEVKYDNFVLNKEIHSLPKLRILLYLLPRPFATFSELQTTTGISSGNLNGQCGKLEELGYIERIKQFINERKVTVFMISTQGISELRTYGKQITQLFNSLND